MENILRIDRVTKRYQNKLAIDQLSFDMPQGTIFGLLGPNGAGKTSLIRIITTITRADEGAVYFNGEQLKSTHPSQIGYMPEERGLYKKMKVGEHLLYLAQLKDMSRSKAKKEIKAWFEKFEILDWWDKKVEELSKGMQQKIQFIATVIHRPKLLILDEPFSGLDPINSILIKEEIHQLHEEGTSIIFSTHRMEQVEELCEYIVLVNNGQNILQGKVEDIKNQYKLNQFLIQFDGMLPPDIGQHGQIIEQDRRSLTLQLAPDEDSNQLLRYLINQNIHIHHFKEILPTLNDIFIRVVQE